MFGLIWFRAKVLQVLRIDFNYEPAVPGVQTKVFNTVTKEVRKSKGNEFDAAVAFMVIQADAIKDSEDPEVIEWTRLVASNVNNILPRCTVVTDYLDDRWKALLRL